MKAHALEQRQSACETSTSKINISCLKSGVFTRSQISSATGWLAVACLATLLTSCASKTENEIVGKWDIVLTISSTGQYTVHTTGTETIEFLKDGTVVIVKEVKDLWPNLDPKSGRLFKQYKHKETSVGNYKFVENDRIRLELSGWEGWGGAMVATVSISDNTLIFTMPDGRVKKYQRAK